MSQSPLEPGADDRGYQTGWSAISRLLRRGFSWSGKERDVALSNRGGWEDGAGRFVDVSAPAGLDLLQDGRAAARLDWDLDGDVDLIVSSRSGPRVRVLRNDQRSDNHWVALDLVGSGPNKDAIGARVEVLLEGGARERLVATRRAGEGFLAQSSRWLHFGLGEATISAVRVRWPGGEWETFEDVRFDRQQVLVQGTARARSFPAPSAPLPLAVGAARPAPTAGAVRVPLLTPLLMPSLTARTSSGGRESEVRFFGVDPGLQGKGTGRPIVMTLFSHTCAPCARDLAKLAAAADDFQTAEVDLVALSVDPASEASRVEAFLERSGYPGTVGRATQESLLVLHTLQALLLDRDARLPVPATFLIDHLGQLQVLYLGEIDPAQLFADLRLIPVTDLARREAAAVPFIGRGLVPSSRTPKTELEWLERGMRRRGLTLVAQELAVGLIETRQVDEAMLQLEYGMARLRQSRLEEAERHFYRCTQLDPTAADAWKGLGYCLHRREELELARDAYRQAASLDPDDERNRFNLGMVHHALGEDAEAEQIRRWFRARRSELLAEYEERLADD